MATTLRRNKLKMALLLCLAKNVERCASDIIPFIQLHNRISQHTHLSYIDTNTSVVYTLVVRWNATKILSPYEVVIIQSETKKNQTNVMVS